MLLDRAAYVLAPRLRIQELVGEIVASPPVRDAVNVATSGAAALTLAAVMSLAGGGGPAATAGPALAARDGATIDAARHERGADLPAALLPSPAAVLGPIDDAPQDGLATKLAQPQPSSASPDVRRRENPRIGTLLDEGQTTLTVLTPSSRSISRAVVATVSPARVAEKTTIGEGLVPGAGRSPSHAPDSGILGLPMPAL